MIKKQQLNLTEPIFKIKKDNYKTLIKYCKKVIIYCKSINSVLKLGY